MKLCSIFQKSPSKIKDQLESSRKLSDSAEKQVEQLKATLDGEQDWFLTIEEIEPNTEATRSCSQTRHVAHTY